MFNYNDSFIPFNILFVIVPIFIGIVFIFTIALIFSPKLRSKLMSKQVKAMNYMIDDNKDTLKHISSEVADISSEGIEKTARAIKKGLTEEEMFCKYCGSSIDGNSVFCKHCGKEQ